MVAIVHTYRENRHDVVEGHTPYVLMQTFQILLIIRRQCHHTSEIIVDNTHLHALRRLFQQHGQDLVPHLSMRDDEIFEQDKFLRFFQRFQHLREHLFPAFIIDHFSVAVRGITRVSFQITADRLSSRSGRRSRYLPVNLSDPLVILLFCPHDLTVHRTCRPPFAVQKIHRHTYHGRKQNQQYPVQLYRRTIVFIDQIQQHQDRQNLNR